MKAIHYTQREAGLALGLSRWETVKSYFARSITRILTGVILSSGRIFGEAAALIYTAGQSAPALDFSNWNPLSVSSPLAFSVKRKRWLCIFGKLIPKERCQMALRSQQVPPLC